MHNIDAHVTLCSIYEELGYNEHPAVTNTFLLYSNHLNNVKKFHYEEHPFRRDRFFASFQSVLAGLVSRTQCMFNL